MTSWHEVIRKDGTRTGKLVKCKSDPCPLPGHADDIQAESLQQAYRKLESRRQHSNSKKLAKNDSKSRGRLHLDPIYEHPDRARLSIPIKPESLTGGLEKRGVTRTAYHNQLKSLTVILPTVNRKAVTDRKALEDAISSVNVIGYQSRNGYEVAVVELSKKMSSLLGSKNGDRIPGVIILSMDGHNRPSSYHWDGSYDKVTAFNVSGGHSKPARLNGGVDEKTLIPRYGGRPISRTHFNGAVDAVGAAITEDDWAHLTSLTDTINGMLEDSSGRGVARLKAARRRVLAFLESDDDNAMRFRAYCGPDVSMEDVTDMIMSNVHSMTDRLPYHGRSLRRSILSATSNDMNKKRYVASVMFFAGRCCYCGVPLHKGRNGNQANDTATGEHLDPINGFPPGETRFGNMALCCYRCNDDKSDKPLDQWLDSTRMLSSEQVQAARDNIKSFRDFALYEPMNEDKARFIESELKVLTRMQTDGASNSKMRERINKTIVDFQSMAI